MSASACTRVLAWNWRTRSFSGKIEDHGRGRLSPGAPGRRRAEVSPQAEASGDQTAEIRPESLENVFTPDVWRGRRNRWRLRGVCLGTFSTGVAANGARSSGTSGVGGKSLCDAWKRARDF